MRIYHDAAEWPTNSGPTAIAIGNFDGVHLGHREIFERTVAEAARLGGLSVVLTFSPHPAKVLAPDRAPPLIQAEDDKIATIAAIGLDAAVLHPFDQALAALPPGKFVQQVLVDALGAGAVFVGTDFTFGRNRAGTRKTLRDLGARHGFSVHIVEPVAVQGIVASSTKVREFVLEGRPEAAALLLGRPFGVTGVVVPGAGRGRTIGVPTANLEPSSELQPRLGVYAGRVVHRGGVDDAVINVGTAPTFGQRSVVVEAHLLDVDVQLDGERVEVQFHVLLRDERRFSGPEELVAQIRRDIDRARQVLRS